MTFLEKVSNFMKLLGEAHKAGVEGFKEGWNENVAKPGDRHPVKTVANFDENENNEFDDFVATEDFYEIPDMFPTPAYDDVYAAGHESYYPEHRVYK